MELEVGLGVNHTFQLKQVLCVYGDDRRAYVTLHAPEAAADGGAPILGPGRPLGTAFLKQLAGAWSTTLRAGDILARYGGEEFALALPGTNLEHARQMLERLRESLPEGQTCSAGVCRWDGSESAESLIARADAALYAAKAAGRDRVSAA